MVEVSMTVQMVTVARHQEVCQGEVVVMEVALVQISREKIQAGMMIENLNGPGISLRLDDRGILFLLPVPRLSQDAQRKVSSTILEYVQVCSLCLLSDHYFSSFYA